ncbi:hypothetical protein ACA910_012252 [Epithemia clementina (nom. ined.)]
MFSQSSESSSSSSKAVYMAVPLLPKDKDASTAAAAAEQETSSSLSSSSSSSFFCLAPSCLHFLAGSNMGIVCYYAVHALVLPSLPHMTNPLADSAFSALIWSAITTVVAYTLWFGFILVFRSCQSSRAVVQDDEDEDAEASFWDEMEYYYALGVFLGFSAACIISLAMAGVPSIFLMAVIFSAFLWTRIMAWMGRREIQNKKNHKTVLPMVVV